MTKLKTLFSEYPCHPLVAVMSEDGTEIYRGCGYSWCVGDCGLPALVASTVEDGVECEYKVHSSMGGRPAGRLLNHT